MSLKARFFRWAYVKSRRLYRKHCNAMFRGEAKQLESRGIKVADHAIRRYFERIERRNIEALVDEWARETIRHVVEHGDGKYVIGNLRVTVVGNTIVTIDEGKRNSRDKIIPNPIKGLKEWAERHMRSDEQRK